MKQRITTVIPQKTPDKGMVAWYFSLDNCSPIQIEYIFFKLGFIPGKVDQPLQHMELQQKEAQKDAGNLFRKERTVKRCQLIVDFKTFRS